MRLRLEGFLSDRRIAEPLLLNREKDFNKSLSKFLSFILGDIYRYFNEKEEDTFSNYYSAIGKNNINKSKVSQITILDLSLIPFDVLENITGLIGD